MGGHQLLDTTVSVLSPSVTTVTPGVAGTNEVVTLTLTLNGGTGNFTLTFGGQTTGNIAHNANAATVETAFEALSTVGTGNGTCAGTLVGGLTITFTGDLHSTNVGAITADLTGITGDTPDASMSIVVTAAGVAGTNEVQKITMPTSENIVGGTFTVTFDGQTSGTVAYNASAATLDTALEALSNIPASGVTCARTGGGSKEDPYIYTVTFSGTSVASTDVAAMTCNGTALIRATDWFNLRGDPTRIVADMEVTAVAGTSPTLDVLLQDRIAGMSLVNTTATWTQATAATTERETYTTPFGNQIRLRYLLGGTDSPTATVRVVALTS